MKKLTNREIRRLLSLSVPRVPWAFKRDIFTDKSAWRVFSGKREGIQYTVQVLSWWAETDAVKRTSFVFFVDETAVESADGITFQEFVVRCVTRVRRLAQAAQDRANKLEDVLEAVRG